MTSVIPRVADFVPTFLPMLFMFVFIVAGTTIGYLLWRSSRGPAEF